MADPIRVSGPISGTDKTLTFETGKLAPQSQGAVVAIIGETRASSPPPMPPATSGRASTSSL